MQKVKITNNFLETVKVGEEIGKKIKKGTIFALHGNLGSGKTTFVQGLARGLKIDKKIISPTFIIVRKYELPATRQAPQPRDFYHIDLYRVESENDIKGLGLEEILNYPTNIVAIEWPEKIEKLLPKTKTDLFFEYLQDDKRSIKII